MIEIQNNKKKNIKYIFIFLLLIIFFAFILNFTFNFIQNKIVSIINSEQFEKYIFYKQLNL